MAPSVPARRRRHSGASEMRQSDFRKKLIAQAQQQPLSLSSHLTACASFPPPRPKSTPADDRAAHAALVDLSALGGDDDADEQFAIESDDSSSEAASEPEEGTNGAVAQVKERPTKPLPNAKVRSQKDEEEKENENTNTTSQSPAADTPKILLPTPTPSRPLSNPSLVPVQARAPTSRSSQRRLIVVLEQACLESYRVSSGGGGPNAGANGGGKHRRGERGGGEAKYALLNCDDHQGILAKTGRDIADARPDITHQVRSSLSFFLDFLQSLCAVLPCVPSGPQRLDTSSAVSSGNVVPSSVVPALSDSCGRSCRGERTLMSERKHPRVASIDCGGIENTERRFLYSFFPNLARPCHTVPLLLPIPISKHDFVMTSTNTPCIHSVSSPCSTPHSTKQGCCRSTSTPPRACSSK